MRQYVFFEMGMVKSNGNIHCSESTYDVLFSSGKHVKSTSYVLFTAARRVMFIMENMMVEKTSKIIQVVRLSERFA